MDSYGLINLVLITVIYSTFVAPSLAKLGELRDQIIELERPNDISTEDAKLYEFGDKLEKKLSLYTAKFNSLKSSLTYFYTITFIVAAWLLALGVAESIANHSYDSELGWLVIILAIIFFLRRSIKNYMILPRDVRSIKWLVQQVGLNPTHYKKLIEAKVVCSLKVKDTSLGLMAADFGWVMKRPIYGYRYLLTVESVNQERCYHIATGPMGNNTLVGTWFYRSGKIEKVVSIGVTDLMPGKYKTRLFIFDAAYPTTGSFNPAYLTFELDVDNSINEAMQQHNFSLLNTYEKIDFNGSGYKIDKLAWHESAPIKGIVTTLLESKDFKNIFKKAKRAYYLSSTNGSLDKMELKEALKHTNIYIKRADRLLRTFRKRQYVTLMRKD